MGLAVFPAGTIASSTLEPWVTMPGSAGTMTVCVPPSGPGPSGRCRATGIYCSTYIEVFDWDSANAGSYRAAQCHNRGSQGSAAGPPPHFQAGPGDG